MTTDAWSADHDLFRLGQQHLDAFVREFASYDILADPAMELHRGTGMLCYYDRKTGHIYLSLPDLKAPEGKLHLLFLRSLLSCPTDHELLGLFHLLLPYVVAHELGHHFRHRYGRFTDNLWHEEQVANQLAVAVTKHRLSPDERKGASDRLKRAMDGLADRLGIRGVAADSYRSIWQAFGVDGQIEDAELEAMELAQRAFAVDPLEMLSSSGQLSDEISARLERRESLIDEINEQYASDYVRYMYYQLGWMYLELTSPERQYVEAFAQQHLGLKVPLLPLIADETPSDESAILACFKAYQDTSSRSRAASRYFYKRYRSTLMARLRSVSQEERFRPESTFILQAWEGQAGEADMLAYLSRLAPPALQGFFPHQVVEHPALQHTAPQAHLPAETDRRLWQHVCLGEKDPEASNLLARLALLDQIEVYRALPAEVMLELSHSLCRIKLAAGETIIWEGERNDDVYIVIDGQVEILNEQGQTLNTVHPGEVVGEMAFFTDEPRSATVRAVTRAECFVLKDTDLHLLAFKYPSILMQIARILAKRLVETNKKLGTTWHSRAVHLESVMRL